MKSVVFFLSFFVLWANSSKLHANETEDLIDRLEQKLLESRRDTLLLEENWKIRDRSAAQTEYKYAIDSITADQPGHKDLEALSGIVNQIEAEVADLSAKTEKLKLANKSEFISRPKALIKITIDKPEDMIVRDMNVSLNDYEIFRANDAISVWLPQATIPLYQGPLKEGKHQVKVYARLAKTINSAYPVDDDIHHIVNQNFEIEIKKNKPRHSFNILLKKINEENFKAEASLLVEK